MIPRAARVPSMPETPTEIRDDTPAQPDNSKEVHEPEELETARQDKINSEDRPAMSAGLTSSQRADLADQSQGSRLKALPRDEQIAPIRAHKNLGHPSPERLSTILRTQGYRPEVSQAALELKCPICQANATPKLSRPGTFKDDL